VRVLPLFIAVALSASLVACSGAATSGDGNAGGGDTGTSDGGGGTDDSTGLPDPCALVTEAEVEAAVGGPVAAGEALDPGPNHYAFGLGRQCIFIPENGVVSATFITVYTYSADGWDQYKESQASFSSYHDVAGIGDEALSAGIGQIGVHQGDLVLDIQMGYEIAQDPAGEARLQALATTALGNL
jgi:hypothetical protein